MPSAQKREPSLRTCQRSSAAWPSSLAAFNSCAGCARGAIFGRENAVERGAEHFGFFISGDVRGALVPVNDVPFGIHREDRVFLDVLDEIQEQPFRVVDGMRLAGTKSSWAASRACVNALANCGKRASVSVSDRRERPAVLRRAGAQLTTAAPQPSNSPPSASRAQQGPALVSRFRRGKERMSSSPGRAIRRRTTRASVGRLAGPLSR